MLGFRNNPPMGVWRLSTVHHICPPASDSLRRIQMTSSPEERAKSLSITR